MKISRLRIDLAFEAIWRARVALTNICYSYKLVIQNRKLDLHRVVEYSRIESEGFGDAIEAVDKGIAVNAELFGGAGEAHIVLKEGFKRLDDLVVFAKALEELAREVDITLVDAGE